MKKMDETIKFADDPETVLEIEKRVLASLKKGHGFTKTQINNAIKKALNTMTVMDSIIGLRHSDKLCGQCGLCCRTCTPINLTPQDITNISSFLNMSITDFHIKYVETDGETFYFKYTKPCVFLYENKCSIYPVRPLVCKAYPYSESTREVIFREGCDIPIELVKIKAISLLGIKKMPLELQKLFEGYAKATYAKVKAEHPNAEDEEIANYVIQQIMEQMKSS